jgi:predicted amino acid dehydrogenase
MINLVEITKLETYYLSIYYDKGIWVPIPFITMDKKKLIEVTKIIKPECLIFDVGLPKRIYTGSLTL